MYCSQCGSLLRPNSSQCSTCGATLHGGPIPPQGSPIRQADDDENGPEVEVENHLVKAILVTLLCCMPFGVVAIVYAAQVSGLAASGKIKAARRTAKKADDWGNYGLIAGLAIYGLYFLYLILVVSFVVQQGR